MLRENPKISFWQGGLAETATFVARGSRWFWSGFAAPSQGNVTGTRDITGYNRNRRQKIAS
jgi:hypothetical protein